MADRGKVLLALKQHLLVNDGEECVNCPYEEMFGLDCVRQLYKDALELLKEQEPRVLTLDEVLRLDRDYYYLEELRIKSKVPAMYLDIYRLSCVTWPSITGCRQTAGDDKYNRVWRCWTERPTDEQRKAVKWDV